MPLRWAATSTGQRLPLDLRPVADGNVMLLADGRCKIVPVEERATCTEPLYKSHFATCPAAEEFRRRVRAGISSR